MNDSAGFFSSSGDLSYRGVTPVPMGVKFREVFLLKKFIYDFFI
jgi:hypothetical protein